MMDLNSAADILTFFYAAAKHTCKVHPEHKATPAKRIEEFLKTGNSLLFTRDNGMRLAVETIGYDTFVKAIVESIFPNN